MAVAVIRAATSPSSWDEALARKIARRVAERKLPMFSAYREYGRDDLFQEGLTAIVRKHADYDPTKSALPSWYYRLAMCRLLDLHRARTRIATNERAAVSLQPTEAVQDCPESLAGDDIALSVPDWLRGIYQHARRSLTAGRYRQGRRFFNVAQTVAVGLLSQRFELSIRNTRQEFLNDQDKAEAVHFRHVPSHGWFQGAPEVCTAIFSTFSGPQKAALRRLMEHPLRTERITV